MPLISICIPAYKRVNYLKRLLDSISSQTFRDFEVIITDDSNDDSVKNLAILYQQQFDLIYHKNLKTLGTPANWNAGISIAKGEWIKLMHDDDWFATNLALEEFVKLTGNRKGFIFSAYENRYESALPPKKTVLAEHWKKRIIKKPETIFAHNVIGPPSVTLIHKSSQLEYDERLKWRVDQEFYIRLLKETLGFTYTPVVLINIGVSSSQVTRSTMYNPSVEIPEGLIMLQKHGIKSLANVRIYDTWWRLFRNMRIRNEEQLYEFTKPEWPQIIIEIINDLSTVPEWFLRIGIISKFFMTLSFLKNRNLAYQEYDNRSL